MPNQENQPAASNAPTRARVTVCPYCGTPVDPSARCAACRGLLDPLSRQATQNTMGPWFIRDPIQPFRPGCSYEVVRNLAIRARITLDSVVRGPTTHQFWVLARNAPGLAHLLGECHACHAPANSGDPECTSCGTSFRIDVDRQHLGLTEVHIVPGQSPSTLPAVGELHTTPESAGTAASGSSDRGQAGSAAVGAGVGRWGASAPADSATAPSSLHHTRRPSDSLDVAIRAARSRSAKGTPSVRLLIVIGLVLCAVAAAVALMISGGNADRRKHATLAAGDSAAHVQTEPSDSTPRATELSGASGESLPQSRESTHNVEELLSAMPSSEMQESGSTSEHYKHNANNSGSQPSDSARTGATRADAGEQGTRAKELAYRSVQRSHELLRQRF